MGSSRGCELASPRLDGRVVVADEVGVKVPRASVALSTASVYPESTATAFELAARLGYDGVEVMVSTDAVSQEVASLQRLSDYYEVPIVAIHSPCLLITQRVWATEHGSRGGDELIDQFVISRPGHAMPAQRIALALRVDSPQLMA